MSAVNYLYTWLICSISMEIGHLCEITCVWHFLTLGDATVGLSTEKPKSIINSFRFKIMLKDSSNLIHFAFADLHYCKSKQKLALFSGSEIFLVVQAEQFNTSNSFAYCDRSILGDIHLLSCVIQLLHFTCNT